MVAFETAAEVGTESTWVDMSGYLCVRLFVDESNIDFGYSDWSKDLVVGLLCDKFHGFAFVSREMIQAEPNHCARPRPCVVLRDAMGKAETRCCNNFVGLTNVH